MPYHAQAPSEAPVPLPAEPSVRIAPSISVQPPLSRRGHGPTVVLLLPPDLALAQPREPGEEYVKHVRDLDPGVVQKWAEEGFAVVSAQGKDALSDGEGLERAIMEARKWRNVDQQAGETLDDSLLSAFPKANLSVNTACLIRYGSGEPTATDRSSNIPTLYHLIGKPIKATSRPHAHQIYSVPTASALFDSLSTSFDTAAAGLAHSRSLAWVKKALGGPIFDLEAIWDEHTLYEFGDRSVAKTMGTMVAEPYVNHIPTLTGGIGRKALTEFYRDHFIFSNPPDTAMTLISRCLGHDRIVEEFVFSFTHSTRVDWMLPGVPPTGRRVEVAMTGAVGFRGDRLYHEHISWDQATVYRQIGLLPSHVPFPLREDEQEGVTGLVRLPTADGADAARKLADPSAVPSNAMMGAEWGVSAAL